MPGGYFTTTGEMPIAQGDLTMSETRHTPGPSRIDRLMAGASCVQHPDGTWVVATSGLHTRGMGTTRDAAYQACRKKAAKIIEHRERETAKARGGE